MSVAVIILQFLMPYRGLSGSRQGIKYVRE